MVRDLAHGSGAETYNLLRRGSMQNSIPRGLVAPLRPTPTTPLSSYAPPPVTSRTKAGGGIYLPFEIDGTPVLHHQAGDRFLYEDNALGETMPLHYRSSMNIEAKISKVVLRGETVEGRVEVGQGGVWWLRVLPEGAPPPQGGLTDPSEPSNAPPSPRSHPDAIAKGLRLNQEVMINRDGASLHALIDSVNDDGTFSVVYTDDDVLEEDLKPSRIDLKFGHVPLLGKEPLRLDDADASLVLIFPRSTAEPHFGTVDPDLEMTGAKDALKEVFVRKPNAFTRPVNKAAQKQLMALLDDPQDDEEEPTQQEFFDLVREKFIGLLQQSGLRATSFPSIDGDEVYVKISMSRTGGTIAHLAERYGYLMPLNAKCYLRQPEIGDGTFYPGGGTEEDDKPGGSHRSHFPVNDLGQDVPAFTHFVESDKGKFQPFREIDEIRIIEKRLDRWVNIPLLHQCNIISGYFAAAKYDDVVTLHEKWASLSLIWRLPSDDNTQEVRDFFGEEVAFYFRWFVFYCRWLAALAVPGFICFLTWHAHLIPGTPEVAPITKKHMQLAFGAFLLLWATAFCRAYECRAERTKQAWGMEDFSATVCELPTWRTELEGTTKVMIRKAFSKIAMVLFCAAFMVVIFFLEFVEHGKSSAFLIAFLIKVVGFLWGKVAPYLVGLQNHRFEDRYEDALTVTLASVKIFVAIFPFLQLAFITPFTNPFCAEDLQTAVSQMYASADEYPKEMVNGSLITLTLAQSDRWLDSYTFESGNSTCIQGCHPLIGGVCDLSPASDGSLWCKTQCIQKLEDNLIVFYATHVLTTVVLVVFPIFLTKRAVREEMDKHEAAKHDGEPYSFLQFQAKCYEAAPYEYYSWGGSRVEDFLELAVGFTLLACFGILVPGLSVVAFFSHIVEYRLVAFRTLNVTCRPMPNGADGIGIWHEVFQGIAMFAVLTNVGLVVFVLQPYAELDMKSKFLLFIVFEHLMLGFQYLLSLYFPHTPMDVMLIGDFNNVLRKEAIALPHTNGEHEVHDFHEVEVSVDPDQNRVVGLTAKDAFNHRWGPGTYH